MTKNPYNRPLWAHFVFLAVSLIFSQLLSGTAIENQPLAARDFSDFQFFHSF